MMHAEGKSAAAIAYPKGEIYRDSYNIQDEDIKSKSVQLLEKHLTGLDKEYKFESKRADNCKYIIYDPEVKAIKFYTRMFVDGEYCAPVKQNTQVAPTIPHKLWFASRHKVSDLKKGHKHYDNMINTVQAYQKTWGTGKVDYKILDRVSCVNSISRLPMAGASSTLVNFYLKEVKESPSSAFDVCRAAVLFKKGGYFFNEVVEVIEPSIAKNDDITFVGVKSDADLFLPSFIPSVAEHPVLRIVIRKYMNACRRKIVIHNRISWR